MPSVLLIDDDPALLDVLTLAFEDEGYDVSASLRGAEGLRRAVELRPDVLVCDINMPDVDGFAICRRLRDEGETVPILLLTSRDTEIDEALGLDLGADDYVTKPFSTRVLLSRVAALIRRSRARTVPARDEPRVVSADLVLFPERLEVRYRDVPVSVTVTEFRLLQCMVERPGRVLSRAALLEWVRDDTSVVADRIVDTYVRRLRMKLKSVEPSFECIETVIGAGYRWKAER